MLGSVTRQNVVSGEAPRVYAACSWSVPISSSTGATSRITKGSETNAVAIAMPGQAKAILR